MIKPALISRRVFVTAGMACLAHAAAAAPPPNGRLAFAVFRNGSRVGEHLMRFLGEGSTMTVTTDVAMRIKLGPVPIYRYRHHAEERWAAGRFVALDTTTDGNGRKQRVAARRGAGGLDIETERGRLRAPTEALPLTHWNPAAFTAPLFHPQEGRMLKVKAVRTGPVTAVAADGRRIDAIRWTIRGEVEIDDDYDLEGVWVGLRGRLPDGSVMEYRRL